MITNNSDSLQRWKTLIKKDCKRRYSKEVKEEIKNLLVFFITNCPSKDGPEIAKKFVDYGIAHNSHYSQLKKRINNDIGTIKGETYKYFTNGKDMELMIDEIEEIYSSRKKSKKNIKNGAVIYFAKGKNAEMDSLYIRIRNSFAHGNYFKHKKYYYLWNESDTKNRTKRLASFMALEFEHLALIYKALSNFK